MMNNDLSQVILGKNLDAIDADFLVEFFSVERIESTYIEFKSFPKNGNVNKEIENIYKACCAFANTEGGVVIWGAPKGEKKEKNEKVFIGDLTPIMDSLEKDQLINKITSNIIPLISGVRMNIVSFKSGHICVIEIQKSPHSPHCTNNIYYMRLDGQSKPAPHTYVEALFKKITYPQLVGYMGLANIYEVGTLMIVGYTILIDNLSTSQQEENLYIRIASTARVTDKKINSKDFIKDSFEIRWQSAKEVLYFGEPFSYTGHLYFPTREFYKKQYSFVLIFGGKKSPLRFSAYDLMFNKGIGTKTINKAIIKKKENIYFSDNTKTDDLDIEKIINRPL